MKVEQLQPSLLKKILKKFMIMVQDKRLTIRQIFEDIGLWYGMKYNYCKVGYEKIVYKMKTDPKGHLQSADLLPKCKKKSGHIREGHVISALG